jgi:hypothetical protein
MPATRVGSICTLTTATLLLCVAAPAQTTSVVTSDLQLPYKLTWTAGGNLLVSEAGGKPNTGRISLVTRSGDRRSLIEGLPSGLSNPNLTPIGPTGIALQGNALYIAIAEGDAVRNGPTPGSLVLNPAGVSSPIFSSVLWVQFSDSPDNVMSPFTLKLEQQWAMADGATVTLTNTEGLTANMGVLVDFPPVTSDPVTKYRHSDPFGLSLDPGNPNTLWLVDSGQNTLVQINLATNKWQVATRFAPIKNPTSNGPPFIDAVPTMPRPYGGQVLVSMLSGFPFLSGNGSVQIVDPASHTSHPWIAWLTTAIDVAYRTGPSGGTQVFVLGFSANLDGNPPGPGELWQFDSPDGKLVVKNLVTPTGMAMDAGTGEIFITELATGLLKKVQLN